MPAAGREFKVVGAHGSFDLERARPLAANLTARGTCTLVIAIMPRPRAMKDAGPRWQIWLSRFGEEPLQVSAHPLKTEAEQQIDRLMRLLVQYDATDDAAFAALVHQLQHATS
jgi:hypothetical protein